MPVTLGDKSPPYSAFKHWVARFRTRQLSTEVGQRSGTTASVTIPENVDAINSVTDPGQLKNTQ
jgi:hypothetical protein